MSRDGRDLLTEIAAELQHETDLAFLLFDGDTKAWVPKSMTENNGDGTFTMPEWLAKDKGFI
jgi:hypothetical protein